VSVKSEHLVIRGVYAGGGDGTRARGALCPGGVGRDPFPVAATVTGSSLIGNWAVAGAGITGGTGQGGGLTNKPALPHRESGLRRPGRAISP
jgi:hypothetical protein